jgi:hypothetical protein
MPQQTAYPTTATQTGSGVDWSGVLTEIGNANYNGPSVYHTSDANSKRLVGQGFGFLVPSGATILGIEAYIRRLHADIASPYPSEVETYLLKNGVAVGNNKASGYYTNAWDEKKYGSPTDLWGATWTPADINNANFGLGHTIYRWTTITGDPYVDYFKISVYYSVPGAAILSNFM